MDMNVMLNFNSEGTHKTSFTVNIDIQINSKETNITINTTKLAVN